MSNLVTKVSKKRVFNDVAYQEETFPSLRLARAARAVRTLGRILLCALVVLIIVVAFAPWQQFIRGEGDVIAFDPFERPQVVPAPIKGRIVARGEGVQENAFVKKGQLLFEIQDLDPFLLERLKAQVVNAQANYDAEIRALDAAKILRNTLIETVRFEKEALASTQNSRDEMMSALNSFVKQAENKLEAERKKRIAAVAKKKQAEADFIRKRDLHYEGVESELKMQEAEQKFADAAAYVEVADADIQNAVNGLEGKKKERESKRLDMQAKIEKLESLLQKSQAGVEKADLDINKFEGSIAEKNSKLIDAERKLSVQQTQKVESPRDGYIMNLAVFDTASIVKPGDPLCRIVPKTENPAVQIWVAGNDAPLIQPDENGNPRKVRLQFEGWPAVQFSGWPSVAVGTFGGEVALVDPTDDGTGKFRVVIKPDPDDLPWPKHPYLRQGVRANGWIQLEQVPLAYEIWRRMNGFPPSLKSKGEEEKFAKPPVKGKTTS